jgi:hypothetical protein
VVIAHLYLSHKPDPLWPGSGISLLLLTLLKIALFYAIRRGMFRAKMVVALACAYLAYSGTHLRHGYLAGVALCSLGGWSLLVLLKNLLTLAALILMFTKPRGRRCAEQGFFTK